MEKVAGLELHRWLDEEIALRKACHLPAAKDDVEEGPVQRSAVVNA
jgi:hypothetical protein